MADKPPGLSAEADASPQCCPGPEIGCGDISGASKRVTNESSVDEEVFKSDPVTLTNFDLLNSASGSSCGSGGRLSPEKGLGHVIPREDIGINSEEFNRRLRFAPAANGEPWGKIGTQARSSRKPSWRQRKRTVSGSKTEDHIMINRSTGELLYTKGRPPWYNSEGQQLKEPLIIGISGGSASGKTTVAHAIIDALNIQWVTHLSLDSFYKVLNAEQHELAARNEYNFDHPNAFDFDLLRDSLQRLREGKNVEVPVYNFTTHSREKLSKTMYGADVIILEGILAFHRPDVVALMDMRIFVDTDADLRLARRLLRDTRERGREIEGVLKQYEAHVKPAFDSFIAPSMKLADLYVPQGGRNKVAIDMIVQHIRQELDARGYNANGQQRPRQNGLNGHLTGSTSKSLPQTLHLLPQTPQIIGLHTFIRNRKTSRDEFIFYAKRLMRILFECALAKLPFRPVTVRTPQNTEYCGKQSSCSGGICAVSILRAGETLETALREVVKNCKMGKILIQTNPNSQEPELHFLRLPKEIHNYHVLLLDATVATGAAAIMAIRVLLDHEVPEENIVLISLMMAQTGVHSVAYAFPKVQLVTTAVDPELNEQLHILPGMGNFGDRYYGTVVEPVFDDDSDRSSEQEEEE